MTTWIGLAARFYPLPWPRDVAGRITKRNYARFWNPLEVRNVMPVSNEVPESLFAYVIVAGKRARQLMSGASPLIANPRSHKPTRVAMEELSAGQLEYKTPDLDAADRDKRRKD